MLLEISDAGAQPCVLGILHFRPTAKISRSERRVGDVHPPFLVLENHPNGDRYQQIDQNEDQHNTADQGENRGIGLENESGKEGECHRPPTSRDSYMKIKLIRPMMTNGSY